MTKTTSTVLICLFLVLILFFGIFAFILDGQPVNEYKEYHNAFALIRKSGMFTDTIDTSYSTELNEGVEFKAVQATIRHRLEAIYGYYSVNVSYDVNTKLTTVSMPEVVIKEGESTNLSKLSYVASVGKVEILNTSYSGSGSYSEDSVALNSSHLRNVSTRSYVQNEYTYYICSADLTSEGTEAAKKAGLSDGSQYQYAIDETVNRYPVVYSNGSLQIYCQSKENSKMVAAYIKYGELGAELTYDDATDVIENKTGWIYFAVLGAIIVASMVFFAVRYKLLGLAGILSQLIAVIMFIYAAALIYFNIFNLFAAIGLILAYGFMTFFTVITFERIRSANQEKTFASSAYKGFYTTNKLSLIAHAAFLALGIILWVIPTAVTAPLGNVFVYGAIISFIATFALNRLFVKFVEPFYEATSRTTVKK
ncbi:MAG: hypothetical protein NC099_05840 [Corallococcus sp.]|nr:hypothetical protein [Corallococcus sp.]